MENEKMERMEPDRIPELSKEKSGPVGPLSGPSEAVGSMECPPPSPPPPSIGRIVHYIPESETDAAASNYAMVVPALIVSVSSPLTVNLQVFIDGVKGSVWKTSVKYDAAKFPGTWHWPVIRK